MDKTKPAYEHFTRILQALDLMAAPEGTTIKALTERLAIPRRSVLSLLNTMEQELHLPVISCHETFTDQTVYRLSTPYAEKLSRVKIDITLDFHQALFVYRLLCGSGLSMPNVTVKNVKASSPPDPAP
jgi:hypothetical protein